MKWAHLPAPGGLFDQDPELLDKFNMIFSAIEENEREEQNKREQENKRNNNARTPRRGKGARSARVM